MHTDTVAMMMMAHLHGATAAGLAHMMTTMQRLMGHGNRGMVHMMTDANRPMMHMLRNPMTGG